jgi:hypothetical protein
MEISNPLNCTISATFSQSPVSLVHDDFYQSGSGSGWKEPGSPVILSASEGAHQPVLRVSWGDEILRWRSG